MTKEWILELIDGLRARGVSNIRVKDGAFELELAGIPALNAGELPVRTEDREKLLADPNVPEETKQRIAEEDTRDLYAAS